MERGGDASSERCDRVWEVALGAQGRIVWVGDGGKRQIFGSAWRGDVLRGESAAFRRSGIRKRRCIAWRGGGTRASHRNRRADRLSEQDRAERAEVFAFRLSGWLCEVGSQVAILPGTASHAA
jgi:hypothetical protein